MRDLAETAHVSVSSVKDWRRGAHQPCDIEKVNDIAKWAHVGVEMLLAEVKEAPMEKLSETQLDVLCELWNQAHDFIDLAEKADHFVWRSINLRNIPDSLLHDVKPNDEGRLKGIAGEILSDELHLQTMEAYERACRRAYPYVGKTELFVKLCLVTDIINEVGYGEEDGEWLPDPDMVFESHEDGYVAPMRVAERKGRKLLDEVAEELVEARRLVS